MKWTKSIFQLLQHDRDCKSGHRFTIFFRIRSVGAVCRSKPEFVCCCFYHTDWLTFAVVPLFLFIRFVVTLIPSLFFGILDYSKRFLCFSCSDTIENIETRMTTNMFVEFSINKTCVCTQIQAHIFVCVLFQHLIPPFISYIDIHTKSYFENDDAIETAKTITPEKKQGIKHGEMS